MVHGFGTKTKLFTLHMVVSYWLRFVDTRAIIRAVAKLMVHPFFTGPRVGKLGRTETIRSLRIGLKK